MPIQDLTPQLRTRLSRLERAVGWFISIATILLLAAFAYYVYSLAERKGWFKTKVQYSTFINNVSGIKVGDPVRLMGYAIGEIYQIEPNAPGAEYGITVHFNVNEPYFGYIWLDSKARIVSEILGSPYLEVLKGYDGEPTVGTNSAGEMALINQGLLEEQLKKLQAANTNSEQVNAQLNSLVKNQQDKFYTLSIKTNSFWIPPDNAVNLTERLGAVVDKVDSALPNILGLTNQVANTLTNASGAALQLQATLAEARVALTNVSIITSNLRDPKGSLGTWLIPTNLNAQIEQTMQSANTTLQSAHSVLDSADTNMTTLVTSLDRSLNNLANLTSNLNSQVQANSNMLAEVSAAVVHTDELVQGLKRHWLLRSAFKTNKPPEKVHK